MIRTINGDIDSFGGRVLAHEHLQIDLSERKGPETILGPAHEADITADLAIAVREHGLKAVVDLGADRFGRDPLAYRRIAAGAGLHVVCATGYYWDPIPSYAEDASTDALRTRMVTELTEGIDDTGIRCGVIKIGTDSAPPSAATARIFAAAAQAATATGAAVVTHTTKPEQAWWQIEHLRAGGLDPSRILISHMHLFGTVEDLVAVGRHGVFMGIDQIGFAKGLGYEKLADLVAGACAEGLVNQLIISSDMARHTRLRRFGGTSYATLFTEFLPRLRTRGVTEAQIDTMMQRNPETLLHFAA
jgi:phosphotriesterase-related protein